MERYLKQKKQNTVFLSLKILNSEAKLTVGMSFALILLRVQINLRVPNITIHFTKYSLEMPF